MIRNNTNRNIKREFLKKQTQYENKLDKNQKNNS